MFTVNLLTQILQRAMNYTNLYIFKEVIYLL